MLLRAWLRQKSWWCFNGDAIRTQASMQRVRENASEFGHCSTVKKHFRLAMQAFFNDYKETTLHAQMMRLFIAIKHGYSF